jgi:DNA replication protein DnaC
MSTPDDTLMQWQENFVTILLTDIKDIAASKKPIHRGIVIPGPPGTGKTFGINHGIMKSKMMYPEVPIEVTATTGAAASRLGNDAMTLATWLSVGMDAMKLHHIDEMTRIILERNPERVKNTQVLVIDEVSMLSQRQLENLSTIFRRVRQDPSPFGGMYVILI